ncbi:hypothetical protein SMMN14_02304 [Sphaerulina musiva]
MLVSRVLRRQCVILRRASTVAAHEARRPTSSPKSKATNDGLHAFFHHFAPTHLPRTESAKRTRKTTSKQHLKDPGIARERGLGALDGDADQSLNAVEVKRGRGRPRKIVKLAVGSDYSNAEERATATKIALGSRTSSKTATSGKCTSTRQKRARAKEGDIAITASMGDEVAPVSKTANNIPPSSDGSPLIGRRSRGRPIKVPRVSLRSNSPKHHDLESFVAYSTSRNVSTSSTVYRGTFYEYTVRAALESYHFNLHRTGKSNDLGIDLLGQWSLPQQPQELKVIVQCKLSVAQPCNVRELEGAYVGAPAGWNGDGIMALLISARPATLGVRSALQRSRLPMGFLQITEEGSVQQFIWNAVAQEARLMGMSTTKAYGTRSVKRMSKAPEGKIALVYDGRPL